MNLEHHLEKIFGYSSFRTGQKEVIEALLNQQDTFAVLPTGTGKSLCYQMTGKLLSGTVIIVSPLLSLMEDQVNQLLMLGETKVLALNSTLSFIEREEALLYLEHYKFIFVSPETLVKEKIAQKFSTLTISLFVVDEAHCVSQWGIDFRPEYTNLGKVQEKLGFPLTLALTATATPAVKEDILMQLFNQQTATKKIFYSVDRPNIALMVKQVDDKYQTLLKLILSLKKSGIIYCATRKAVELIDSFIRKNTQLKSAFYHGGLTSEERSLLQQQFKNNELDVLCATNAFGMGIDKSDIRFVIHFDCPDSLENYVQEIGRAGRDGKESIAILLYKTGDESIHHYFQSMTKEEREFILQLIEKQATNEAEIFPYLNEIQQKWLLGYLNKEYTFDELKSRLLVKEKERKQQLGAMLRYINETQCRRRFIQQYFSEAYKSHSNNSCCDCCGITYDSFTETQLQSQEKTRIMSNWQEILIRLFKE